MANPETAERHPRIDHERAVVLALADQGRLDENGILQKPTHKEMAERLYKEVLSKLRGRSRDIRLAAAIQSVREIGRRFIDKVDDLASLREGDRTRTTALFEEIEGMYSKRTLGSNDLYEIFGISQSEAHNPFGSHYLNIKAPPLPQPETDPLLREVHADVFIDHRMSPEGNETVVAIGTPSPPQSSSGIFILPKNPRK